MRWALVVQCVMAFVNVARALSSLASASSAALPVIPSGLVAVYKPQDWSSSDVVNKVKFVLQKGAQANAGGRKCRVKVGHGGTLDPLAQGVLVLGVGDGTRLLSEYLSGDKEYLGSGRLGAEMDTQDSTGTILESVDPLHVTREKLEQALGGFRGEIMQMPPMYSALKRDGKKLYELARAGIEVEREQRPVTIFGLSLLDQCPASGQQLQLPDFGLQVTCSGGTYVRTLMSDLGRAVDTRAYMTQLVRSRQGPFVLQDCLRQEEWTFERLCAALVTSSSKAGLDSGALKSACIWPDTSTQSRSPRHRSM